MESRKPFECHEKFSFEMPGTAADSEIDASCSAGFGARTRGTAGSVDLLGELGATEISDLIVKLPLVLLRESDSDREGCPVPSYTRSVPLNDLGADGTDLAEPIQVEIEFYEDEVVVKVPELDLWASEATESEALLSMKNAIYDLWQELADEGERRLGKLPRTWKRILQKKIRTHVAA
jgi:hypothetical protein